MTEPRTRVDGWTPERREIFFSDLRTRGLVAAAAAAAGPSASSAYRLYRRDAAFAARWDTIFDAREAELLAQPNPTPTALPDWRLMRMIDACDRRNLKW